MHLVNLALDRKFGPVSEEGEDGGPDAYFSRPDPFPDLGKKKEAPPAVCVVEKPREQGDGK